MEEMLEKWAEGLELEPERPMDRRLFYEVTGERFSKDDFQGEDSNEFNSRNLPEKRPEMGLELSALSMTQVVTKKPNLLLRGRI